MAKIGAKELSWRLGVIPFVNREFTDVRIQSFRSKRTRRDSSVTTCFSFILHVTFIQDRGMNSVKFITGCCFYVFNCRVDKKLKVFDGEGATVDVVKSGNVKVVADVRFERME